MTKVDYVGLAITLVAFAVIFSPLAMSDSDPYKIKGLAIGISESIEKNILSLFEQKPEYEYEIILQKKISFSELKGGVYHLVPGQSGSIVSYLN